MKFDDGTALKADLVVFATGFQGNLRIVVRDLFGDGVANVMDDFWVLTTKGDQRCLEVRRT